MRRTIKQTKIIAMIMILIMSVSVMATVAGAVASSSSVSNYKNLNSGNKSEYGYTSSTIGDWDWKWPISASSSLSSCYVDNRTHRGIDVSAAIGNNVTAAYGGTVISAVNNSTNGFGTYIIVQHTYKGKTFKSLYAHLNSISVSVNSTVTKGQLIGKSGNTGNSSGPHLHFSIWEGTAGFPSGSKTNVDPFLNHFLEVPASMIAWNGTTYPNNSYTSPGCCTPYLDAVKWEWDHRTTPPTPTVPDVYYKVRTTSGSWLPEVKNTSDYAGIQGKAITDVAIKVSSGSVKYRVHVKGGNWLPYVTGYNTGDSSNGYAGNGQAIDAIQVIYTAPSGTTYKSYYRVSPLNSDYYSYQINDSTANGMDGYAGSISSTSKTIDRFQIYIGN